MSMPIIYCRFVKALESEDSLKALARDLGRNLKKGHFSIWPCKHKPHCRKLTEEEMEQLFERLEKEVDK